VPDILVIVMVYGINNLFYFLKSKKEFMKHKNKNWEGSVKARISGNLIPTVL
jgi:hypothetical protein